MKRNDTLSPSPSDPVNKAGKTSPPFETSVQVMFDGQRVPFEMAVERLAVMHEAFGFGRVDEKGCTTHGFDPDGLVNFANELWAMKDAQTQQDLAPKKIDHAVAAIQFALTQGLDADAFLRCWNEGDWEAIRKEWPEAPENVYVPLPDFVGG